MDWCSSTPATTRCAKCHAARRGRAASLEIPPPVLVTPAMDSSLAAPGSLVGQLCLDCSVGRRVADGIRQPWERGYLRLDLGEPVTRRRMSHQPGLELARFVRLESLELFEKIDHRLRIVAGCVEVLRAELIRFELVVPAVLEKAPRRRHIRDDLRSRARIRAENETRNELVAVLLGKPLG